MKAKTTVLLLLALALLTGSCVDVPVPNNYPESIEILKGDDRPARGSHSR